MKVIKRDQNPTSIVYGPQTLHLYCDMILGFAHEGDEAMCTYIIITDIIDNASLQTYIITLLMFQPKNIRDFLNTHCATALKFQTISSLLQKSFLKYNTSDKTI